MREDFKRQLWITVGIFFGAALIYGFGFSWLSGRVDSMVGAVIDQRGLIRQAATLNETLASLKLEKAAASSYGDSLNQLVPDRDELVVGLSQWLTSEARIYNTGVSLNFQGTEAASTGGSLGHSGFLLKLSGSFADTSAFLKHLERESKKFLMNFESFDITQGSGNYSVSVTGLVYYK